MLAERQWCRTIENSSSILIDMQKWLKNEWRHSSMSRWSSCVCRSGQASFLRQHSRDEQLITMINSVVVIFLFLLLFLFSFGRHLFFYETHLYSLCKFEVLRKNSKNVEKRVFPFGPMERNELQRRKEESNKSTQLRDVLLPSTIVLITWRKAKREKKDTKNEMKKRVNLRASTL